ncbi:MAG: bifunctional phosphopantothenoylcysteine decarboxylase/phosphopantothenate--cysteine ligase CoaBC [Pseudomonadota bacterium]
MKKILLGVAGGIAAYKTPQLVRRLIDRDADVQVVMTDGAHAFVTPLSLAAVSGRPVRDDLWDEQAEAAMGHIELARWADEILIAPATANVIAKLANGIADDLLTTLCLASDAPLSVAPAMNRLMWANAATAANVATLRERGVEFFGPAAGDQACGETGPGRMVEPEDLAEAFMATAAPRFNGETVVLTAGPTREPIDPVRYITNRSSGRMGYALAKAFREAGANVKLVTGPVNLACPAGVDCYPVETAQQMLDTVLEQVRGAAIFIGAAAIADYSPASFSDRKIKKSSDSVSLDMVRAPDTLATVAALEPAPFCVGFAAETHDLRTYAVGKLERKRLDMIVANQVGKGLGFDCAENTVTVFWAGGEAAYPTMHKMALARQLVALIGERFDARPPAPLARDSVA